MDYSQLRKQDLIELCKRKNIKRYSGKNKAELISLIKENESKVESKVESKADFLDDLNATTDEADEFIQYLPTNQLFQYERFTKVDKRIFLKALSMYTSPLYFKENGLPSLSLMTRLTVWSMINFKEYFSYVVSMIMKIGFDRKQVYIKKKEIYSIDLESRNCIRQNLLDDIRNWWRNSDAPIMFAIPMYALSSKGDHAVFLGLQKDMVNNMIKVIYIDSGGTEYILKTGSVRKFINDLQSHMTRVNIVNFDISCPVLQTFEQGGNCVQWQMIIMSMFVLNTTYFSNPEKLLTQLAIEPIHNLLIFQLYMFFYIWSKNSRFPESLIHIENKLSEENLFEFIIADIDLREKAFPIFPFSDCSQYTTDEKCPRQYNCVFCDGKCVNKNIIITSKRGNQKIMSPKKVINNMREMYNAIFMKR